VWDPNVRRYLAATFVRQDGRGESDEGRRENGTAEGDAWAKRERARMVLGLSSSKVANLAEVGKAYIEHRGHLNRAERYIDTIENTVTWAAQQGVTDLATPGICGLIQSRLKNLMACRLRQVTPRPATPRTKNQHIAILQAMGNFAVRRGHCLRNPFGALERYTEARRVRKVYTLAELRVIVSDAARDRFVQEHQQLLATINGHGGDKAATARALGIHPSTVYNRLARRTEPDPWWIFMVLATYTGLRSETIRELTWSMVDREARRIRVPAEITKSSMEVRVPIQPELDEILESLPRKIGKATILPTDIADVSSDLANQKTQAYLRSLGIEPDGRSVHAFRHTAVALFTASGLSHFSVMDAVGHSSTQTSKHYARMADEYREQVRAEGWSEGEFFLRRSPPKVSRRTGSD